jgi:acetyltransferase-like isoleucine patch superfamily enzyme
MKKMLQKIIAKFFNSSLVKFNPYILDDDNKKIDKRIAEINNEKIENNLSQVIIGKGSKFYDETSIQNAKFDNTKIVIGDRSHVRGELLIQKYGGKILIGNNSFIGTGTRVWSGDKIEIGNNVLVSHNCNIIDTNSHEIDYKERALRSEELFVNGPWETIGSILTKPIVIMDDVWISFNVTILKGVTIGKGSIIAANSVVTKDVPAFSLAVGNPAKVIKQV